jgi:hypothetical protein
VRVENKVHLPPENLRARSIRSARLPWRCQKLLATMEAKETCRRRVGVGGRPGLARRGVRERVRPRAASVQRGRRGGTPEQPPLRGEAAAEVAFGIRWTTFAGSLAREMVADASRRSQYMHIHDPNRCERGDLAKQSVQGYLTPNDKSSDFTDDP